MLAVPELDALKRPQARIAAGLDESLSSVLNRAVKVKL